jgi:hypothetical protein
MWLNECFLGSNAVNRRYMVLNSLPRFIIPQYSGLNEKLPGQISYPLTCQELNYRPI